MQIKQSWANSSLSKVFVKLGILARKDFFFGCLWFLSSLFFFYLTFGNIKPVIIVLPFVILDLTILSYFISYLSLYISLGWIFYLIAGFLLSFKKTKEIKLKFNPHAPLVSVLIPARNEENVIKNILEDLKKQTYQNWEAIVVAHNCNDRTFEIASSVKDDRIKVLRFNDGYGKPVALNFGVKHAKGDIVVVFDADARIDCDFLDKLIPYFQKYDAVQARVESSNPQMNILTILTDLEWITFTDSVERAGSQLGLFALLGGTGQAIKYSALKDVGFWDERILVEDYDLSLKLLEKGYKLGYAPDVKVYDEKPCKWSSFFKQRARWLRGDFQVLKKYLPRLHKIPQVWHILISHISIALCYYGYVLTILYLLGATYYTFYFHFWIWLWVLNVSIVGLRVLKERGLKMLIFLPLLILFNYHWLVVCWYVPKVKSWKESKTEHFGTVSILKAT
jgi:cellulose synthase/poly-beta-1,6-N-acetylglucosamine synthase-like glycosyltransferase